tara:strand:- start:1034 stop:2011 length:978 start_codon:yes stop_codon:yes gene_type:complete
MKIVVTGGSGFIGSHFIEETIKEKEVERIYNFDKMTPFANENLPFETDGKYSFYKCDISTAEFRKVKSIFKEVDCVVHFAAESCVDKSFIDSIDFVNTNVLGTYNLLSLCMEGWKNFSGKKFIHFSTDEVYGSLGKKGKSFTNRSSYKPNNPYAATKASSDLLVRSFVKTYGFPAIILNSTNNYGSRQQNTKLIPKTISNWINEIPITVYGTGKQVRDWFYVKDCVNCVKKVIFNDIQGNKYLIGGKNEMTNLDILKIMKRYFEETMYIYRDFEYYIDFVKDRLHHDFRYSVDISDFEEDYGKIIYSDFEETLKKTVDYYIRREK